MEHSFSKILFTIVFCCYLKKNIGNIPDSCELELSNMVASDPGWFDLSRFQFNQQTNSYSKPFPFQCCSSSLSSSARLVYLHASLFSSVCVNRKTIKWTTTRHFSCSAGVGQGCVRWCVGVMHNALHHTTGYSLNPMFGFISNCNLWGYI